MRKITFIIILSVISVKAFGQVVGAGTVTWTGSVHPDTEHVTQGKEITHGSLQSLTVKYTIERDWRGYIYLLKLELTNYVAENKLEYNGKTYNLSEFTPLKYILSHIDVEYEVMSGGAKVPLCKDCYVIGRPASAGCPGANSIYMDQYNAFVKGLIAANGTEKLAFHITKIADGYHWTYQNRIQIEQDLDKYLNKQKTDSIEKKKSEEKKDKTTENTEDDFWNKSTDDKPSETNNNSNDDFWNTTENKSQNEPNKSTKDDFWNTTTTQQEKTPDKTGQQPSKTSQNTFTDSRDGNIYNTVTIGNKTWMAENLAYNGGSYKVGDLNTVCPSGWHLATLDDWVSLCKTLYGNEGKYYYQEIFSYSTEYAEYTEYKKEQYSFTSDNYAEILKNLFPEIVKIMADDISKLPSLAGSYLIIEPVSSYRRVEKGKIERKKYWGVHISKEMVGIFNYADGYYSEPCRCVKDL